MCLHISLDLCFRAPVLALTFAQMHGSYSEKLNLLKSSINHIMEHWNPCGRKHNHVLSRSGSWYHSSSSSSSSVLQSSVLTLSTPFPSSSRTLFFTSSECDSIRGRWPHLPSSANLFWCPPTLDVQKVLPLFLLNVGRNFPARSCQL